MSAIALGALDLGSSGSYLSAEDALACSIELAPKLEALGYSRYWLAEHHERSSAHSCPEIMVAVLAGITEHMRIGTGGVALRYYSPLKVAKTFALLQTLYEGRIDLGLVRGLSSDPTTHQMLAGEPTAPEYEPKVVELTALVSTWDHVSPRPLKAPQVWLMGSNLRTAQLAARLGNAFCLGLSSHESVDDPLDVLDAYRSGFRPSERFTTPTWSIAVAGICAATQASAQQQMALAYKIHKPTVVGSPVACRDAILAQVNRYESREVVFMSLSWSFSDRYESYRLLAEALGIKSRQFQASSAEAAGLPVRP